MMDENMTFNNLDLLAKQNSLNTNLENKILNDKKLSNEELKFIAFALNIELQDLSIPKYKPEDEVVISNTDNNSQNIKIKKNRVRKHTGNGSFQDQDQNTANRDLIYYPKNELHVLDRKYLSKAASSGLEYNFVFFKPDSHSDDLKIVLHQFIINKYSLYGKNAYSKIICEHLNINSKQFYSKHVSNIIQKISEKSLNKLVDKLSNNVEKIYK